MIDCHRLDLSVIGAADLALLNREERARAARFHFERDRLRYIAAHAQLRRLLGSRLAIEPALVRFTTTIHGKPTLAPAQAMMDGSARIDRNLYFNFSHSEEVGYLAIAPFEVGIDVERIRPLAELQSLIDSCCTREEIATLAALPVDLRARGFLGVWTRKEATLKTWGTGIGVVPLNELHVGLDLASVLAGASVDSLPCPALRLSTFTFEDEIVSVATLLAFPQKIRMLHGAG